MRSLEVYALGIDGQGVGGHVTGDFEHTAVVLHSVLEVHGGIVDTLLGILVILFSQIDEMLHLRVGEVECNLRMVGIVVCHNYLLFCL